MPKSKYSTGFEGQRFGRWTVIKFVERRRESSKSFAYMWLCRCDCGNESLVGARILVRGKSLSCGCLTADVAGQRKLVHGYARTKTIGPSPEHRSWIHATQRVDNPNANPDSWHRYGGRGITACEGFRHFPTFIRIIGDKPTLKHSIDRINNNGNYSCGECEQCLQANWPMNIRWATPKEQAANTCRSPQYQLEA